MSHISVTMLPGHSPEQKRALAHRLRETLADELGIDTLLISVSVEELPIEDWNGFLGKIPDGAILIPEESEDDEWCKKCSCDLC